MPLAPTASGADEALVTGQSILIVDDDSALRALIGGFLREHGFAVREAADVPSLRAALARARPDLVLLDVMMPGEDGLAALRTIPTADRPPVIVLSTLATETDRIVGLELGADDYLPKPCNPRELLARVRAVLRRSGGDDGEAPAPIVFAGWTIDPARFEVASPDGEEVSLTTNEFRLLHALATARGAVLGRERLVTLLGGDEYEGFERSIDIAVSRLRRKLAVHRGGEALVRTVRGEGYALTRSPAAKG